MTRMTGQQGLLFAEEPERSHATLHWPVQLQGLDEGWRPLVCDFLSSDVGLDLSRRLTDALQAGQVIYPAEPFRALSLTPRSQVRVVILGQDPYHGPGQAQGLAFSVAPGAPAAQFAKHFQRAADELGCSCAHRWLPGALGQARRFVAEHLPDGSGRSSGQPCAMGLGGFE